MLTDYINPKEIKTISYKKGEAIYSEGEECISIAILESGSVKASRIYMDGHETTIRLLNTGDIIGLSLIFSSSPYYQADFHATSDTKLSILPKEDLLKLIKTNREFSLEFLSLISDTSKVLNTHIKLLSYKTIRERLCYYFYREYQKNNSLSFHVNATKTALADFLNVERPSLSYELNKLIKEKILENQGHQYTILNLSKIEEYI